MESEYAQAVDIIPSESDGWEDDRETEKVKLI